MKGIFFSMFLLVSIVSSAQSPHIQSLKSIIPDSTDLLSSRYLQLGDQSVLQLKQPEIKLSDDFYTILQAPNVDQRYTTGSLLIKKPELIPEMPVAPVDPFNEFYLLNLDPVFVPAKEE
ncbi:MAG: hypothetical protein R8G66_02410 [Cytophagales bacterium]|nr:hypothetical protein [Cytophagales bacterium]